MISIVLLYSMTLYRIDRVSKNIRMVYEDFVL